MFGMNLKQKIEEVQKNEETLKIIEEESDRNDKNLEQYKIATSDNKRMKKAMKASSEKKTKKRLKRNCYSRGRDTDRNAND